MCYTKLGRIHLQDSTLLVYVRQNIYHVSSYILFSIFFIHKFIYSSAACNSLICIFAKHCRSCTVIPRRFFEKYDRKLRLFAEIFITLYSYCYLLHRDCYSMAFCSHPNMLYADTIYRFWNPLFSISETESGEEETWWQMSFL